MAVILKKQKDDCLFGLWQINETEAELMQAFSSAPEEEKKQLSKFKNPEKRIERIAVRLLIYELLGEKVIIDYDEYNKPFIRNSDKAISISHTTGMIAVQICSQTAGVDIEKISERVAKIAHKFLSPAEIDQIDLNKQLLHMYAIWCAKETIYKIYGRKKLDFKKHIRVKPFDIQNKGVLTACLSKDNERSYELEYFIYALNEESKYMIVRYCR